MYVGCSEVSISAIVKYEQHTGTYWRGMGWWAGIIAGMWFSRGDQYQSWHYGSRSKISQPFQMVMWLVFQWQLKLNWRLKLINFTINYIGLRQSWKLCLDLWSHRWLKPSYNLEIKIEIEFLKYSWLGLQWGTSFEFLISYVVFCLGTSLKM